MDDISEGVALDDFYAIMPLHGYMYAPTRDIWPAASVDSRLPPMPAAAGKKRTPASKWLDCNRPVEQVTWCPGLPMVIHDRLMIDGGWVERKQVRCLNLYRPPIVELGDAAKSQPWRDHIAKVYGEDTGHIISYLAHRVQHPRDKINHALVLGGAPGIGKDTLLVPVRMAVGPWNFQEISPSAAMGRFNGFLKSVILRISEARDLGEFDRFKFYDHTKTFIASPPEVLRVDEKHLHEYAIFNCCAVIVTTNHKTDGIYLPADDRRHFVAWSELSEGDFPDGYWDKLYGWYEREGNAHVAAYLANLDITGFDPKAPLPKTEAFWAIVDSGRAPEYAELADALDRLNNPPALTLDKVRGVSTSDLAEWMSDRKNRRAIPHRMEKCGYIPVRNDGASDGMWRLNGSRQVVYGRSTLTVRDRHQAAQRLANGTA
jgi:Family of unknown function (DUF5906)